MPNLMKIYSNKLNRARDKDIKIDGRSTTQFDILTKSMNSPT